MKTKLFLSISLAFVGVAACCADTLSVTGNETFSGGLYDYSYQFSLAGLGPGVDTLFLGSDDLSPLFLAISLNGTPASDWSWLGNDTPQNYLEFFSTDGSTLSSSDTLGVTFASELAPSVSHFAVGLDSSIGAVTNTVNDVLAPTAVPEPAAFWVLMLFGAVFCRIKFKQLRKASS